ncbi:MAG: hypothetical protein IEMM0006_1019 [bacterium]|nr:MAG: hypothetical protein IEMM0006_1019 [bacterium]
MGRTVTHDPDNFLSRKQPPAIFPFKPVDFFIRKEIVQPFASAHAKRDKTANLIQASTKKRDKLFLYFDTCHFGSL